MSRRRGLRAGRRGADAARREGAGHPGGAGREGGHGAGEHADQPAVESADVHAGESAALAPASDSDPSGDASSGSTLVYGAASHGAGTGASSAGAWPPGWPDPAAIAHRVHRLNAYYDRHSPYLLAEEARERAGRRGDSELVYGVTPWRVVAGLLRRVDAGPADVFFDLGCGVGHAVLVAATICGRAVGVEVLPDLRAAAEAARASVGADNVAFLEEDMRTVDLRDATVLYSYATCFKGPLREAMAARVAEQCAPGTRVITVTHALEHPRIVCTSHEEWPWIQQDESTTSHHHVYFQRVV